MLSGMLDAENMSQILRGIGQKRQNGSLELNFGDKVIQIIFSSGKIVDVIENDQTPAASVLQRLIAAAIVEAGFDVSEARNYSELFLALNDRPEQSVLIDEELFRKVVKHRVLDMLYGLDFEDPAVYNFKVQMPDYDRHFAPSISVSQLLLDRVALETDNPRFVKLFPYGSLVRKPERGSEAFSEEEQAVLQSLKDARPLEELCAASLLSAYHFQSALLALFDRAAIEVELSKGANGAAIDVNYKVSDEVMGALESSSERPFIDADQLWVEPEENGKEVAAAVPVAEDVPLADIVPVVEEEEEEIPFEQEDGLAAIRVNSWMLLNSSLLQSNLIPDALAFIFVVTTLFAAFVLWGPILAQF